MRLSLQDKVQLYHELSKLVKAGFGFDRSAELLEEQARSRAQGAFASGIRRGLRGGRTITDAVAETEVGITELETSVLRAAERGGVLESGFSYLAEYFESILKVRREIRGKLIYPAFLIHFAVTLASVPTLVSDPSGAIKTILITLSFIYLVGGVLGLLGWLLYSRAPENPTIDRFLRAVPLIGPAKRLLALERFCNVFYVFLESGQKISDGLKEGGTACQSAVLRGAAHRVSQGALRGEQIGPNFEAEPAFPDDLSRSILNAEIAGSLDEDLKRWSRVYRDRVQTQMTKVGRWLPQILTVVVMLYVGWQIISTAKKIMIDPVLEQLDQMPY